MPEGKWIPLLMPTAPVILVVLQGRKLCKQVFMCTSFGVPQLHQLMLCQILCYSMKCECRETSSWKKTFLLFLSCFSCARCPLLLACTSPRACAKLGPPFCHRHLQLKMLVPSLCSVSALWLVPGEGRNLLGCLVKLPLAKFGLWVGS